MKFGVFYEFQLPRPWSESSEHTLIQHALDQVELADRCGYDYIWEVEHHSLEEYSHSSAPEVFLGAASQRSKNIRLGHGIVQLTVNHPVRVAERIAMLDLVSNGRVEFGMGEGASVFELGTFNRAYEGKRDVWEDAIRAIIPMFGSGPSEYHGPHFDIPLRSVLPKPIQKPHPPLWVACTAIQTIEMAARRGIGALGFQFVSGDAARAWVNHYYNTYISGLDRIADYRPNPNIALVSGFMCARTDEEARKKAEGWTFFQFCLQFYSRRDDPNQSRIGNDLWASYLQWRESPEGQKANTSALIGSPETLRRRLRRWQETHVDQVILLNQAGNTTHEDICESLDLFAREVMPEFHEAETEHQRWKAGVLDGSISLEQFDIAPYLAGRPVEVHTTGVRLQ
jgi:alkanesulfonate monooxygenase SsuD/methylene tetrahydromethanopterin reductase-like flavin-dependent oxidoreductase (luciferase family)